MLISVSQLSSDLTSGLLDRPLHDIAAHKKTSGGRFSVIANPASGPFKEFNRRRSPSFPPAPGGNSLLGYYRAE
jgi:hypothetical protein